MTLAALATILETNEKNVIARAKGMRLLPVCGRCGGTGHYSFNGSHSICYGCNGAGQIAPKEHELPSIIAEAEAAKTDGRFATYMRFLEAQRVTRNASDKVMTVWKATGISNAYNWRKACNGTPREDGYVNPDFCQRDADIAAINAKMAAAYCRVTDAGNYINSKSKTYHADMIAFAELLDTALAEIEAARLEFMAYQESN